MSKTLLVFFLVLSIPSSSFSMWRSGRKGGNISECPNLRNMQRVPCTGEIYIKNIIGSGKTAVYEKFTDSGMIIDFQKDKVTIQTKADGNFTPKQPITISISLRNLQASAGVIGQVQIDNTYARSTNSYELNGNNTDFACDLRNVLLTFKDWIPSIEKTNYPLKGTLNCGD